MANQYIDIKNLRYLLYDVHGLDEVLNKYDRFQDHDKESIDILLDSVKDFSDKVAYPCFREMDEDPARFEDGTIYVHPKVKDMMEIAPELGFSNGPFDYEDGGLQLPLTVMQAIGFILDAANISLSGYPGMTAGAAALIISFGSQELKEKFTPNMLEAKWGGTMCLTEPQAGSSLSDVTTTASPLDNGAYKIKGQKIFISAGDYEYVDNIIHLVLARIDGAPAGTKGISLFAVPKKRILDDGSLAPNDVKTAGDFQKLGQRGFCTAHLSFGEDDNCEGFLVGEANKGLSYMFQLMNGARIGVGRHGVALSTAAYYSSLQYANERPQGRRLSNGGKKDLSQGQTLIKNHPDVRRMLLLQKAISEGGLSLVLQTAIYNDHKRLSEKEESDHYDLLLEILTPVVKTYPAEKGLTSITNGLQILGGYGFCSEFDLQQYYRDIKIMSLYEGTTGIQSLDLLGRKITMKNGAAIMKLGKEIKSTIDEANNYDELKPYAAKLDDQLKLNQQVLQYLIPIAMTGDHERFLADATIFMEFFGTVVIAWQWLKIAINAKQALLTGNTQYEAEFYESKIHTMKFFFKYEVSRNSGLVEILTDKEVLTIVDEKELIA
jgi:butyryl-CoA dehydrogenase